MNEIFLGLDISTSTIGMCGISKELELQFLSYVTLKKQETLIDKLDAFKTELIKYENVITGIFIEDPLVMYKPGFSRAQILSKLSMFNGMCTSLCYFIYKTPPIWYNVSTARKIAFPDMRFPQGVNRKQIVLERVKQEYPEIDWPMKPRVDKLKDECYDLADSVVIARAGVIDTFKR